MMSVEEYALDVNKSIGDILIKCKELGIMADDKDYMLNGVADNNLSSADPAAKGTLTKSSCS